MFQNPGALIAFGILVGVISGIMGIGGGAIMIPTMVLAMGLSQTKAHGTSLAVMIFPVALPAVIKYWRTGNVDWNIAIYTAVGVLMGSFFGAKIATALSGNTLKLMFGFFLLYMAAYTVFGKENLARTLILSGVILAVTAAFFGITKWYDQRQLQSGMVEPSGQVVQDRPYIESI